VRIKAKFPSFCGRCKHPIEQGADIEWSPGTKPTHIECPTAAATVVSESKPERIKSKFVLALEKVAAATPSAPVPVQARAPARDHFVRIVCAAGTRPERIQLPTDGYEEIVLTVGPKARVMERVLVRAGVEVIYLRYNGGDLVDLKVNNVPETQEIGWSVPWSPVVQMAVEGIRLRAE
jgi:hypothetical protein